MELSGFKLSNYHKTRGHEGEAFMANLMYRGKLVGEYADYADGGAPYVHLEKSNWGQDELLAVMQEIHAALSLPFLVPDNPENCAETMCQMLDEGRDMDSMCRKMNKLYSDHCICLCMTGDSWTAAQYNIESYMVGELHAVGIYTQDGKKESAHELFKQNIEKKYGSGEIKKCTGYLVLEAGTNVPLTLSTKDYIDIFEQGRELHQALAGDAPTVGIEPVQG